MKILIACEFSGVVRDAFTKLGHDAWSCDLLPSERPGNHIQGNVLDVVGDGWDLMIAHPPCTEFSIARSGGKPRLGSDGLFLVRECQRIISECESNGGLQFWVIENPATGALRDFLGEPDYVYQPWWFGSPWTKKTALWGHFNEPYRAYDKWEDVPKIPELYVRKDTKHRRSTGKPAMYQLHKSDFDLIPEFARLPRPESDMEMRSLCSQQFARAFYQANK